MMRTVAVFGAILSCAVACTFAQTPRQNGNRIIAGVVVSAANGEPIADADVVLGDTNGFKRVGALKSDVQGRFSFTNVADGKYILSAAHAGYVEAAYEEHGGLFTAIVTGENQNTTGLVLELPPVGAIFGTVTEDSGDPVPQAQIVLFRRNNLDGTESIQRFRNQIADSMGNFEFSSLIPSEYFLCATGAPWYRPLGPPIPADNSVANQGRSPLDVAYPLTCYPNTTDPAGSEPISIRSGNRIEAGLILHPVPAVHIQVRVQRSNPQEQFAWPQLHEEVFGYSDMPLGNVRLSSPNGPSQDPNTQIVDVSGIPAGRYTFELPSPNPSQGPPRSRSIEVTSEGLDIDESLLQPEVQIAGRLLVPAGTCPPSNCSIALVGPQGHQDGSFAVASDGSFQFPRVPPGEYEIRVRSDNITLVVTELGADGVRIAGSRLKVRDRPVELSVVASKPMGSISGFITKNGKPTSGVFLVLVPANGNEASPAWMQNQSDSDGSFIFTNVISGRYTLVAIERGWTLEWRRPEVINRYLANGVKIMVGSGSHEIKLDEPIEVQAIH